MESKVSFFRSKLASTIGLAILSGIVSYVAKQVIASWGVLNPVSRWLGGWLQLHISAGLTGWILALLVFVAFYGFALWFLARRSHVQHVHHKEPQASTSPTPQLQMVVISKEEQDRRRGLIRAARNLAHDYNTYHRHDSFHSYIQRQRVYFDIEPYLGDGSSNGCTAFVADVTRLEREWGLA